MLDVSIKNLSIKQNEEFKSFLQNISFILPPNNIYTIIGKNGSGKSTLIKSLTALLDKSTFKVEGRVLFDEKNILELDNNDLLKLRREKIKYVFQDPVNSFDHLRKMGYYFSKLSKDLNETNELLNYFILPESDTLSGMYPYELSGGMAQRICLTLVLLTHPQIILLDEPTSGIDSPIASLVLLKLKEFASRSDNSVLLVTQDLVFAQKISNKIALLDNGTLSEFHAPDTFFENKLEENERL